MIYWWKMQYAIMLQFFLIRQQLPISVWWSVNMYLITLRLMAHGILTIAFHITLVINSEFPSIINSSSLLLCLLIELPGEVGKQWQCSTKDPN